MRERREEIRVAVEYIHEHLTSDLSLGILAGVAGLSRSHFHWLFKSEYGVPVHRYVIHCRVERAQQLLRQGVGLSEVAQRTGFFDQSHMTRCIRRLTGRTPTSLLQYAALAGESESCA